MDKLIVANWKMYLVNDQVRALLPHIPERDNIILCPSFVHISTVRVESGRVIGAQDVSAYPAGSGTGDVCVEQLTDLGISYVIVGHSERRERYGEDANSIRKKVEICASHDLIPILCVGEKASEIESGESVVTAQLDDSLNGLSLGKIIVAYEPVWAIGTGKTPTIAQIESMHKVIRTKSTDILGGNVELAVLYGGSVDQNNLTEILNSSEIDGVLVGKASTNIEFWNKVWEI